MTSTKKHFSVKQTHETLMRARTNMKLDPQILNFQPKNNANLINVSFKA